MEQCAAFGASDGSDIKPEICLVGVATGKTASLLLKHTPEELDAWATALRTRFSGRPIAVCLEPSRGPRIDALLKSDCLVLDPMHPTTLAKDREACSPSQATDDPRNADSRLERLVHHRDRLKAWRPDHATTRTLPSLVEYRRRLVHDRPRLSHRTTALLKASFPQVWQWFDDVRTLLVCDLLLRWPTLEALKQVRPATLYPGPCALHEGHPRRQGQQ